MVARLDARRLEAWRSLLLELRHAERAIDDGLREEWAVSLAWFEVLAGLQRHGGSARPLSLAESLAIPASSLSRRLDRLAEEGWIARSRAEGGDARAVDVELTASGRRLWREMNVTYRRLVQTHVARHLDDGRIDDAAALAALLEAARSGG